MSAEIGMAQPVAYIRYRSDGGVDGPILAGHACDIRKREWTPLYPHPDPVRAALVEALKPFAKLQLKPGWHDETPTAVLVTAGDIRRADAALKAAGEGLS